MFGYDPTESLNFKLVPNTNLYYVPNEEVDLEAFLQEPPPRAPLPLTLTSHWLAIDGIQPAIPENPTLPDKTVLGEPIGAAVQAGAAVRRDAQEDAEVRSNIRHVLSREMQLYFDTILADLHSGNSVKIAAALEAVKGDSGVQQLLPYFIQHVADSVPKHLRSLDRLMILMRLCKAVLANSNLFVEPYVQW